MDMNNTEIEKLFADIKEPHNGVLVITPRTEIILKSLINEEKSMLHNVCNEYKKELEKKSMLFESTIETMGQEIADLKDRENYFKSEKNKWRNYAEARRDKLEQVSDQLENQKQISTALKKSVDEYKTKYENIKDELKVLETDVSKSMEEG